MYQPGENDVGVDSLTQAKKSQHPAKGPKKIATDLSKKPYPAHPQKAQNTSDHTKRAFLVNLLNKQDQKTLSVQVWTWNLMNRCVSRATNKKRGFDFPNNPWDIDESYTEYLNRKERQLNQILEKIKAGQHDFACLQEIDILTAPPPVSSQLLTEEEHQRHLNLQRSFFGKLKQYHWDYIQTQKPKVSGQKQKPLMILYHSKKFKPNFESLQGQFGMSNKQGVVEYKAFSCQFTYKNGGSGSPQTVTIVNAHLEYSEDYAHSLPAFQKNQIAKNQFTIIIGDMNHPPNQKITGLMNNWNECTNLAYESTDTQLGTGKITPVHAIKGQIVILKCYDCIAVNPTSDTRVEVQALESERFEYDENETDYMVLTTPQSSHVHKSAPGQAWVKDGWKNYEATEQAKKKGGASSTTSTASTSATTSSTSTTSKSTTTFSHVPQPTPEEKKPANKKPGKSNKKKLPSLGLAEFNTILSSYKTKHPFFSTIDCLFPCGKPHKSTTIEALETLSQKKTSLGKKQQTISRKEVIAAISKETRHALARKQLFAKENPIPATAIDDETVARDTNEVIAALNYCFSQKN